MTMCITSSRRPEAEQGSQRISRFTRRADTALFVAATDGPPHAATEGFGLFHASTNGLLALARFAAAAGRPPKTSCHDAAPGSRSRDQASEATAQVCRQDGASGETHNQLNAGRLVNSGFSAIT